jgi:hypothetical protein
VTSKEVPTNIAKSILENAVDLLSHNGLDSQSTSQHKKNRYTPNSSILIGIIIFGVLAGVSYCSFK